MSKITLKLESLHVESFQPVPGDGDSVAVWSEFNCWDDTTQCSQPNRYTCGYDITCARYNCDN